MTTNEINHSLDKITYHLMNDNIGAAFSEANFLQAKIKNEGIDPTPQPQPEATKPATETLDIPIILAFPETFSETFAEMEQRIAALEANTLECERLNNKLFEALQERITAIETRLNKPAVAAAQKPFRKGDRVKDADGNEGDVVRVDSDAEDSLDVLVLFDNQDELVAYTPDGRWLPNADITLFHIE